MHGIRYLRLAGALALTTLLFQAPVAFNALLGAAGSAEPSDFA